jgi:hypothetical protein
MNRTPEQKARDNIDKMLEQSGWTVVDKSAIILKHLGLWNIRSHSPPPLPNIHPPAVGDAMPDVESYFQDFIPSDDQYISSWK